MTNIPYPEPQCCMCLAKRSSVKRMAVGPGISICDRCVEIGHGRRDVEGKHGPKPRPLLNCDFCSRTLDEVHYMMKGEQANICDDCLTLCEDELE